MMFILITNVRLHYHRGHDELLKELAGVKNALERNADTEMQNIYPEGYVFLNATYALAWSTLSNEEAHAEIDKAWMKINSATGRAPFNEDLSPPLGSFYNGWNSYVLAHKLRLERVRDDQEVRLFQEQCDRIAGALQQTTYPPSYTGAAWPADVMICAASLSLHDQLFEPKYKDVIERWLAEVKSRLDERGMIPHSVNGEARGSSMALILIFLKTIDEKFALEQFVVFKENFVDSRFGLTGIREYPKGESGDDDADSGPIIMGFGGAATIVGMQTLSQFDEDELSVRVRNTVETLAFPVEVKGQKKYLFGTLPIADAFIAWSHSGMRAGEENISFSRFHLFSFGVFVILAILFWAVVPRVVKKHSS